MQSYEIASEEDAWSTLEQVLSDIEAQHPIELTFNNWPTIDLKFKGEPFSSSLTSSTMEGLVEFQKLINRSYAQMRYGGNSRATNDDKKELEIIYKVSEGSSDVTVDFSAAALKMAEGLVTKMSGTEMVVTILGLGIIGATAYSFNKYVEKQKQGDLTDTAKELASAMAAQSQEETKRTEILANAIKSQPFLQTVQEEAEETYNKVLRGSQGATSLTIGTTELSQGDIKNIVRTPRSKSIEVQLNGNYRVEKLDNTQESEFIFFISDESSEKGFNAKLEDKFLLRKEESKTILAEAILGRTPVYLKVNAKELRDQIVSATIVGVEKPHQDDQL
ncbi:MAG: hypothetical protein C0620_13630 [Desulfuromonas sp.]|nr:MAG: hypothetical protein C0620_13630 [Desulfuromonas sp.]